MYNITVPSNINSLEIKVETEDAKTSYEINGADDLRKNHDKIKIVLTAENNEQKTYTINIKRLEEDKTNFTDKEAGKTMNKLAKIIFIIATGIAIIVILVIIISHHNKKTIEKLMDEM